MNLSTTTKTGHTHDYHVTRTIDTDSTFAQAVAVFQAAVDEHFDATDMDARGSITVKAMESISDGVTLYIEARPARRS